MKNLSLWLSEKLRKAYKKLFLFSHHTQNVRLLILINVFGDHSLEQITNSRPRNLTEKTLRYRIAWIILLCHLSIQDKPIICPTYQSVDLLVQVCRLVHELINFVTDHTSMMSKSVVLQSARPWYEDRASYTPDLSVLKSMSLFIIEIVRDSRLIYLQPHQKPLQMRRHFWNLQ